MLIDQISDRWKKIALLGIEFEVMHLPGHSMGCTGYFLNWEGKQLVFSGDVIGTLLGGDFGWGGSMDFNKAKYIESLKKICKRRYSSDVARPWPDLLPSTPYPGGRSIKHRIDAMEIGIGKLRYKK